MMKGSGRRQESGRVQEPRGVRDMGGCKILGLGGDSLAWAWDWAGVWEGTGRVK